MKHSKKIKYWAVILKETNEIQTANYFAETECPSSYCPPTIAIFETKVEADEAREKCLNPKAQKVIPVEIIIKK